MTLEELKKRAEASKRDGLWYEAGELRDSLFARIEDRDQDYIAALSPATTLKLLEMITVLRGRHKQILADPLWARSEAEWALRRADEIERSLEE